MKLENKKIGIAFTGSFCTFEKAFTELRILKKAGADLYPIMSPASSTITSRFGTPDEYSEQIRQITGHDIIRQIEEAEPIGPKSFLDALVILPCTGNTAAKLANGITDTAVLMAAKAHLRTNKPLVIAISTNDGLGMNLKNIGILLNTKNIYFVPFGQDDSLGKPDSLKADMSRITEAAEAALMGRQLQPVLIEYKQG